MKFIPQVIEATKRLKKISETLSEIARIQREIRSRFYVPPKVIH